MTVELPVSLHHRIQPEPYGCAFSVSDGVSAIIEVPGTQCVNTVRARQPLEVAAMLEYRLIPLSGKNGAGKFAKVSAEDYDQISKYSWHLSKNGYAMRSQRVYSGVGIYKNRPVYMHRAVLDAPDGSEVDHIDHDRLNNTRVNLRLASRSQNHANRPSAGGTSRYRGVSRHITRKGTVRWVARLWVDQKCKSLGYFDTQEEAAQAYDRAAQNAYGEFATLNFSVGSS